MFALTLAALALLGSTVWVVLNRPVAENRDRADRNSARLLAASALLLAAGAAWAVHTIL